MPTWSECEQIETMIQMHVRHDDRIKRAEIGMPPELLQRPRTRINEYS